MPGEAGLWVFILGDMTVFGLFFGTILVTRGQQPELFRASQHDLHPMLALVNTLLLLVGSLLVVRGVARVRAGSPDASYFFLATSACALGFATIKSIEYYLLVRDGHTPGTNDFFTYYFAFTGIHLSHLLLGAVLVTILAVATRSPRGVRAPDSLRRGRRLLLAHGRRTVAAALSAALPGEVTRWPGVPRGATRS